jgi:hypothetical protein
MSKNFENDAVFDKRPIEDILEDAKKIDTKKIANEVLNWITSNVENFIDNQSKIFKLDLVMDVAVGTEETKKLQDLYRSIPEDNEKELEKSEKCRRILDETTKKAFSYMKDSSASLKTLFDRMVFYYERVIPSPENKRRALAIDEELKELFNKKEQANNSEKTKLQEEIVAKIKEGEQLVKFTQLEGNVSITNFDYECFSIGVQIREGHNPNEDGEVDKNAERKILKNYNIPEGFTVWVEINFKHKQRPTVMF